jgi:hypothetical protein
MITTTALINTILLLCIQIQLKYTIKPKVTNHLSHATIANTDWSNLKFVVI